MLVQRLAKRRAQFFQWLLDTYNPVFLWPGWDAEGSSTAEVLVGPQGSYNGAVDFAGPSVVRSVHPSTKFDGATSYADFPYTSSFDTGLDGLTVMAWVKPEVVDAARKIARRRSTREGWALLIQDGTFRFLARDVDGNGAWYFTGFLAEVGKQYFYAVTYSPKTGNYTAYVDGERIYNVVNSSIGTTDSSAYLRVGAGAGTHFWDGDIQGVTCIKGALNNREIREIYESSKGLFGRPRSAPIPFDPDLALYLDASSGGDIYVEHNTSEVAINGDPVGRWESLGRTGGHPYQGTTSKRPIYNGLEEVISFDAVDDVLITTLSPPSQGTIIMLGQQQTSSRVSLGSQSGPGCYIGKYLGNFAGGLGDDHWGIIQGAPWDDFQVVAMTWDGANVNLYQDGAVTYTGVQNGLPTSFPIAIGANGRSGETADNYSDVNMKEARVYRRALSSVEITELTQKIRSKWGMT